MESPPSTSLWSEAFLLSDDSGLLLTSSSISSGESRTTGFGQFTFELQDSDKSLSQADSLDGMSDIICGGNFNTLKKGPHWSETKTSPIEPPLAFQDHPIVYDSFAADLTNALIRDAINETAQQCARQSKINAMNLQVFRPIHQVYQRSYWTQDFLPFSPCHHAGRPSSRSSLGSSRLSSSHNSLSVPTAHRADDSSFITQAVSHDTLSSNRISDLYNVPFDSDVYAVPVDTVKPPLRPKRNLQHKKRRRNTASGFRELEKVVHVKQVKKTTTTTSKSEHLALCSGGGKRHSVASTSTRAHDIAEPVHMTLQEVRQYLQTLYSSSSDSSEQREIKNTTRINRNGLLVNINNNNKYSDPNLLKTNTANACAQTRKKSTFLINIKNKKVKDSCDNTIDKQHMQITNNNALSPMRQDKAQKKSSSSSTAKVYWLKQTLCNMFRFRRIISPIHGKSKKNETDCEFTYHGVDGGENGEANRNITQRALPPLPGQGGQNTEGLEESADSATSIRKDEGVNESSTLDFATSIRKVKDYGWYWGPLSSEAAEKILSNEPAGSFIVRDSSDDHYIFSLSFKLNNTVRHVRIENDQGNFCFGSCTKFKSQTIVDFIENAVEHSRSGRYLFFLNRRPTIGPVHVQLLHPVSRFKQTQSLQHMCRFVILKKVRKDLITSLPLPRRIIDYLSTPHYYSEHLVDLEDIEENQLQRRNNANESSEEYGNEQTIGLNE